MELKETKVSNGREMCMRFWIEQTRDYHIPEVGFLSLSFELDQVIMTCMAGCDILTLGATAMDMDFVQQYKNLGVALDSADESSDDSKCDDPGCDNSGSDGSGSDRDDPSSSELSDLDSMGTSVVPMLSFAFICVVTGDRPSKRRRHAK